MEPDPLRLDVQAYLEKAPVSTQLALDCSLLTDFGVAPRYPGWEPVSGIIDIGEVLAAARRTLEWALLASDDSHGAVDAPERVPS